MYTNIACREHKLAGSSAPSYFPVMSHSPDGLFDVDALPVVEVSEVAPFDESSSFSYGRSGSMDRSYWSDDEEIEIDPFLLDDKRACEPVVQIRLDLAAQLNEDEIPNPMEFLHHHQALAAYVCHSTSSPLVCGSRTPVNSLLRKNREAEKANWREAREQERLTSDSSPPRGSARSSRWSKLRCKCHI